MRFRVPTAPMILGASGLALCVSPAFAQESGTAVGMALARVYPGGGAPLPPRGGGTDVTVGPDVLVGEILNDDNSPPNIHLTISPLYSSDATYLGFGLGTESCNLGNQNVEWEGSCISGGSNRKPVIPQNMFRLSTVSGAARFEQIGQSWTKHAFTALTYGACTSTCNGQGGQVLGIGCSDPYTAARNGSQSDPSGSNGGTGPRYIVNPFTGDYPWPMPTNPPTGGSGLARRIKVLRTDLSNTSATSPVQFFGECLYVTRDDARYGNQRNNASWRRMFCTNSSTGTFTLEGNGSYNNGMHRMQPVVYAWQFYGNIATNPGNPFDSSVMITEVGTPGTFAPPNSVPTGDGWMYVASRATDLGNGLYHYEYAVENLNSDRMGGSLTIPIPVGAVVSNAQWKGVDSHSGVAAEDATRNEPWDIAINPDSVVFSAHTAYNGRDYIQAPVTAISTGNPATVTSAAHGLSVGQIVLIQGTNAMISASGCYSANSANGAFKVNTVPDADHFTIQTPTGTTVNVAGTTGTWGSLSTLGNGIRWGTVYNFRFDSTALPSNTGAVTLGFYKQNMPGYPNSVNATSWVPGILPCYANCDASTISPILNVADFTCFLQKFATSDPYANCDGSTTDPTLNVSDFTCYLQKFAQGCP